LESTHTKVSQRSEWCKKATSSYLKGRRGGGGQTVVRGQQTNVRGDVPLPSHEIAKIFLSRRILETRGLDGGCERLSPAAEPER